MSGCVLALGFFDGVHLGHGALLRRTAALAQAQRRTAAVLTFDVHPDALVRGCAPKLLTSPLDRAFLIAALYRIQEQKCLHFDRQMMQLPWRSFVRDVLCGSFQAAHLVCGADFRFGAGGEGTAQALQKECAALGIGCDVIAQVAPDGEPVSSSRIRGLLEQGETARAVQLLGHPHLLSGTVVGGRQLGRTIGIPTANLSLPEELLLPRFGVYAAEASFDGLRRRAVVNIGSRPTVNGQSVTVESWLLDYEGELYGHFLRLELLDFLRPEKKFDSLEALRREILHNAEAVRKR